MICFSPSLSRHALLLLLCLFQLTACGRDEARTQDRTGVPVRLAVAESRDIPRLVEAVGNVEAVTSVAVKAQVSGQIVETPVTVGQEVKAGDILFRLDPRPFEAALAEARARLARDKALREKARSDLARYTVLLRQDVISREVYEQMLTAEQIARASIEEDEAAIKVVELQLEYSVIRAPAAGKLGNILIRQGNVIQSNDDRTLVVINSIQPAEVRFSVAERYLPRILELMKADSLFVTVLPEGDAGEPIPGLVSAVNNEVDRTTGSIRLHALFPNEDIRLWPGQFVRVSLMMETMENAVIIPERAVQEGLSGQYVYRALSEGNLYRVEAAPVDAEKGPEGFMAVISGLKPGEKVVIEGHLALAPGALAREIED
ncbi:MAG: efflux RND transporter periplasmic adaptor subunit [Deltaproteobacteria bacterium]|jgi:multidrug efflux system membrane fusion protein|nr:efflux RND transporter periplasmic adaptor subunit [Deltaproteobacteria bacterium]